MTIDRDAYKILPDLKPLPKLEGPAGLLPDFRYFGGTGLICEIREDYASPFLMRLQEMQTLPFDKDEDNKQFAKKVMANEKKLIQSNVHGRDLYMTDVEYRSGAIFAYNPKTQMIDYACEFEQLENPIFGKGVAQTMVWRRRDVELKDIVKEVMLFILVAKYGTIASDTIHSHEGKSLWMKVIKQAFNDGYEVGIINLKGGIKRTAKDIDKFIKRYSKEGYSSTDPEFKKYRFYVSKK